MGAGGGFHRGGGGVFFFCFVLMAGKVSLSSGKKPAQKHKNATAWVVNKHSFAAQKIASLPTYNLCQKCVEILDWR